MVISEIRNPKHQIYILYNMFNNLKLKFFTFTLYYNIMLFVSNAH